MYAYTETVQIVSQNHCYGYSTVRGFIRIQSCKSNAIDRRANLENL